MLDFYSKQLLMSGPSLTPTDPSKLKFGDRIDNKATVVGTYNSKDLGTVVYAVLDAQYRGANINWASGLYSIDLKLPELDTFMLTQQNRESATYNTDYIINNFSGKATEAFTFCRNIEPLTFNYKTYKCQLSNTYELREIFNKKTELDALDPTAEANSTKKLSNWGFGSSYDRVWSSNIYTSNSLMAWQQLANGDWGMNTNNKIYSGVCPIIEIPINTSSGPIIKDQGDYGESA